MIMYHTKEYHLINFINMLINDESVELMNKDVQFILTLDLVMLLIEDLVLDFDVSYLFSSWEYQD
jgi:hypothetical protein